MLARVKRVASSADVDQELVPGGAGLELVAAGAGHVNDLVLGVDAVFHFRFFLASCAEGAGGLRGARKGRRRLALKALAQVRPASSEAESRRRVAEPDFALRLSTRSRHNINLTLNLTFMNVIEVYWSELATGRNLTGLT